MLTSVLIHIDDGILHVSNKDPKTHTHMRYLIISNTQSS